MIARRLARYTSRITKHTRFLIAGVAAVVLGSTLAMANGWLTIAITVAFGLVFIVALPWDEL